MFLREYLLFDSYKKYILVVLFLIIIYPYSSSSYYYYYYIDHIGIELARTLFTVS